MIDLYQNIKNKYHYLPDSKLQELLNLVNIIILEEGEVFIQAGERTKKIGFIVEGLMRNYITTENGADVTVVFVAEMQVITAHAPIFLGTPATETSEALERTTLLVFDFVDFKERAQGDPLLMRMYVEMVEASLVAAIQRIEDFTQKRPEQRYQRLLDTQSHLTDRIPLKHLASYLGITAVSLSRIRKRLSQNRN